MHTSKGLRYIMVLDIYRRLTFCRYITIWLRFKH